MRGIVLILGRTEHGEGLGVLALAGHPVAGIVDFVVGGLAVARLAGGLILVLGFGAIDLLLDGRVEIGGGRAGHGKCETEAEAGRGHGGAKSNHRAVLHSCTRTALGRVWTDRYTLNAGMAEGDQSTCRSKLDARGASSATLRPEVAR